MACTFTDAAVDVAAMGVLLDAWRDGPFVFISSLDVYGYTAANPVTESHPLSETYGDYGRGKVLCERLLRAKAEATGRRDYAIARAPHILGPHPKGHERFTRKIAGGEALLLPGADEREWSLYRDAWIDVRDLAWVIAELLERPAGGALNVLGGHFVWHDFYTKLIRLSGSRSQIVHKQLADMTDEERAAQEVYAQTWRFDDSKLRQRLNFKARYSLEQTMVDILSIN